MDKNGTMIGFDVLRRADHTRLRLVYATGAVVHVIPAGLANDFERKLSELAKYGKLVVGVPAQTK